MKHSFSTLSFGFVLAATTLAAQMPSRSARLIDENSEGGAYRPATTTQGSVYGGPFSRVAIGGSFAGWSARCNAARRVDRARHRLAEVGA